MKEIDFLPAAHREKNALRKTRICQVAMVVMFTGIIAMVAGYQVALYQSAAHALTRISAQYEDAVAKTGQLAAVRSEVETSRQYADLYTYLKHPWPRTQMLAEVAHNVPPQVILRELTITNAAHAKHVRPSSGGMAIDLSQENADNVPARVDLAALRREHDMSPCEITVSGTTTDSGALHLFVMALNGTPLFDNAKLHSFEAVAGSEHGESSFLIHVTVRPGYGQPGGPQPSQSIAARPQIEGNRDPS